MHPENPGNPRRDKWIEIAPFAIWMALLTFLPAAGWSYALRTLATGAVFLLLALEPPSLFKRLKPIQPSTVFYALAAGLLVAFLWIAPESSEWYKSHLILGYSPLADKSPYDPKVCGWTLTLARLAGSAFVIAPVEEFFFRRLVYRWAGADGKAFWTTVALFALEHDRILAGAMAGAVYGHLALRKGLGASIVAHMATNLVLGIYVIAAGEWAFW